MTATMLLPAKNGISTSWARSNPRWKASSDSGATPEVAGEPVERLAAVGATDQVADGERGGKAQRGDDHIGAERDAGGERQREVAVARRQHQQALRVGLDPACPHRARRRCCTRRGRRTRPTPAVPIVAAARRTGRRPWLPRGMTVSAAPADGASVMWSRRIVGSIAEPRIATDRFAEFAELAASVERDPASVAVEATALVDQCRSEGDQLGVSRGVGGPRARPTPARRDRSGRGRRCMPRSPPPSRSATPRPRPTPTWRSPGVLALGSTMAAAFAHLDDVERLGSEPLQRGGPPAARGVVHPVGTHRRGARDVRRRRSHACASGTRTIDLARVLANRGGIYVRRGELRQAVADFDEAYNLFSAAGQEFIALQVRHNLGWAAANLGQLPQALTILDENCQAFLRLGHDASLPLVSRAEVMLSAGLSADALELADEALRRLGAEGDRATAAEAWLLRAQAARLDGDAAGCFRSGGAGPCGVRRDGIGRSPASRRARADAGPTGDRRPPTRDVGAAPSGGPRQRAGGGRKRQRRGRCAVARDGGRDRSAPDSTSPSAAPPRRRRAPSRSACSRRASMRATRRRWPRGRSVTAPARAPSRRRRSRSSNATV